MSQSQKLNGKAQSTKNAFRMECTVSIEINAPREKIWALLTDAKSFPLWNSTVLSIEGEIALHQKIKLRSYLDPKRTFNLKITEVKPTEKLVWEDGFAPMFKGERTFDLTSTGNGSSTFKMTEVFTGLMLPMIAGSLPNFDESFERYAKDLKQKAEAKS